MNAIATRRELPPMMPPRAGSALVAWVSGNRLEDGQMRMMVEAYRRTGGLACGDEVARLLRRRSDQPISTLARWIVDRSVVCLSWRTQTLVPLFQFARADMSLRDEVCEVIRELVPAFDDWDLATWFARPNSWLQDAAPVDIVANDRAAVLQAARADRFIARG